jgi:hypothetical protein
VANPGTLTNGPVNAPAAFIFDTPDGHIEAWTWSPKVDPLIGNTEDKVTVRGAEYSALAVAGRRRASSLSPLISSIAPRGWCLSATIPALIESNRPTILLGPIPEARRGPRSRPAG